MSCVASNYSNWTFFYYITDKLVPLYETLANNNAHISDLYYKDDSEGGFLNFEENLRFQGCDFLVYKIKGFLNKKRYLNNGNINENDNVQHFAELVKFAKPIKRPVELTNNESL